MDVSINKINKAGSTDSVVHLLDNVTELKSLKLDKAQIAFITAKFKDKETFVELNNYSSYSYFVLPAKGKNDDDRLEKIRVIGSKICTACNANKIKVVSLISKSSCENSTALVEGIALTGYQFLKYFNDAKEKKNALVKINIVNSNCSKTDIEELSVLVEATCLARDLVNEPLSYLTAVQYSKDITKFGKKAGFKTEVFSKKKIESLKMGGILAVNKGGFEDPTFNILEWKPKNAKNKKPIVFVGKGIVYDTGGLSLKPTPNSMDEMKCDMGGSASVVGAMYAIAKAKLPVHVVGLIPATENRPGNRAYVPGDVITMYSGTTVEVLNTDAEGRLVLADALTYAQKYNPELVIDLATLTGSAVRALGMKAIASMGTLDEKTHNKIKASGFRVHERLAELPFWDDYAEEVKSPIADLQNLGGPFAGAITAGKFLETFTKNKKGIAAYPWLHLDIAGPAFLNSNDGYLTKGGSGVGVRLLFDFIKNV